MNHPSMRPLPARILGWRRPRTASSLGAMLCVAVAVAGLAGCTAVPTSNSDAPTTQPTSTNKSATLNTQLGIGYLREDKLDLAWKRLHRALEYDPEFSTAHNAMGLLYERLGQPDKAEEHYLAAVGFNPSDSAAQNNFGRYLCSQGRYEEGESRLLQALKNSLYDTPEIAYTNAGLCAKSSGDLDAAETYLRRALEFDPKVATALLSMAEISLAKARNLSARGYMQRYLEVSGHSPNSLWLAVRIERALGDRNAASSYAMLLRSSFPDSRETQQLLESGTQ